MVQLNKLTFTDEDNQKKISLSKDRLAEKRITQNQKLLHPNLTCTEQNIDDNS
jgi:hypothetical protein